MGTIVEAHKYILSRLHEANSYAEDMAYRHGPAETASFDMYREIAEVSAEAITDVEELFGSMSYHLHGVDTRPIQTPYDPNRLRNTAAGIGH